jgi:KUP system potassium uptake protein
LTGTERKQAGGVALLAALGVVFGDLGTSPLYTLQTIVQAYGRPFSSESALGVLSLIVWTLLVTISIKYCVFVMRADNRGEGGILALMSLIGANGFAPGTALLTAMGLLGSALIYGDGVITPAISVLSALEGVNVVTAAAKPYVMPMAVLILIALFGAQRFGTQRIGQAFGPIMLLWFVLIGGIGVAAILNHPQVLAAINPLHALNFLSHAGLTGFALLGGVFLCITGAEALYADMGSFGKMPIRGAWYLIVLPSLLLNYAGQTAFLMDKGDVSGNPFFQIVPSWAVYPMVLLATLSTIIASQAIITGCFSMTRQAVQLGWLPGVSIRQTSDSAYGQIYVPFVNWLMMICTVGITIAFRSSDRLAGAYGTAVATTMLITTVLLYRAMRHNWHWPLLVSGAVAAVFLSVDGSFFAANLLKIADGGWLPLTLALLLFGLMVTWRSGIEAIRRSLAELRQTPEQFLAKLKSGSIPRPPGSMVFLTRSTLSVPRLIMDHVHFTGALPRHVIALSVVFEETPRAAGPEAVAVQDVGEGLWHVIARFGFFEIPDLCNALANARGLHTDFDPVAAVFVGSRDMVVHKPGSTPLRCWRVALFAFLYQNAGKIIDRFNLPAANVIEIARQVEI